MKRFAGLLLLLSILCGCSDPIPNDAPTVPQTPDSAGDEHILLQTIPLENCAPSALLSMGRDLLLVEENKLTLLDGVELRPVAYANIHGLPAPESGLIWVNADGVAYYHEDSRSIIFLNANLRQTRTLQLPEDLFGTPQLSPDQNTVYYATKTAIRALDMCTGAARLLKEQGTSLQSISGVFLNGTALRCEAKQTDGTLRISLISAQNGSAIEENAILSTLTGQGDRYFLSPGDTCVPLLIFGTLGQPPQQLWPMEEPAAWWPLPEQGLIVTARDTAVQTVLDCYSMESGQCIASLYLLKKMEISACSADRSGILWFFGNDTLYRWDISADDSGDQRVYAAPVYTREEPDKTGLAALETAVQQLEQRYGIEIVLGEDAAAFAPQDYRFETEYIPQAFHKALTLLTETMAQFPDNFFSLAADRSPGKKLTIVLVRNIYGTAEKQASAGGYQYWLNKDPYIALSLSGDVVRNFYHEMGHVIDSRVLSTTAAFYEWHKVNPPGFRYDKDYAANLNRDPAQYLTDGDRWFIDTYSMLFEIEDRSRIFEYASQPGNEEFFQSAQMQAKLKRVCNGIRQAFGLKNDSRQFIWEQYLQK